MLGDNPALASIVSHTGLTLNSLPLLQYKITKKSISTSTVSMLMATLSTAFLFRSEKPLNGMEEKIQTRDHCETKNAFITTHSGMHQSIWSTMIECN
ncbi:hypothetical protein HDU78_011503 [Chytriomyces hyalinus]|nr:hypothetical protein HDU78_011503 [Chytriomyces hyalinus]